MRAMERDPPAYQLIAEALRKSIRRKRLPAGLVLQEESLAALFGSSRSPVKTAFKQLLEEALLSRFDGRGVIVGTQPRALYRTPLTRAMLGLEGGEGALPRVQAWQKVYQTIERELIYRSVFGRFLVNELELARYYHIGRTVAHDALLRLQATGIVIKGEKAHWYIVPLDPKRLNDLYDLRELIEPSLLAHAASHIPEQTLELMADRLADAMGRYPRVDIDFLDSLEHDVHVTCLEFGGNAEMLEALKRTRCILISGKHILGNQMPYPQLDPFLGEHLEVIEALKARDAKRARQAMLAHLHAARVKVETRLQAFRESYTLAPISFAVHCDRKEQA